MLDEMYQSEPNLLAEAYRRQATSQLPRRIEKHFDFIEISDDGYILLGTSNLSGRIWSGSIWVFRDCPIVPVMEDCMAGIEFESSIAAGLWLDNDKKVIVGCDSGSLHWLSLNCVVNAESKNYFTTDSIVKEHDDSVLTLAFLKNRGKIISGAMDMTIKVWDSETFVSEKSYSPAHGHIVTSVSTVDDGSDTFASTSLDGTSLIWDIRLEKPASLIVQNDCGYTSSAWIDENCISIGTNDGNVLLVDLRMKSPYDTNFCSTRPIFKLSYNIGSEMLAVCADDPIVRVFTCNEKKLTNVYECDEHKDFVRGLAWEPSSQILHSCGWDSKILSHSVTVDTKNEGN